MPQRLDRKWLCERLANFQELAQNAEANDLQRLLRLMVKRVDWSAEGKHKVQLYALPQKPSPNTKSNQFSDVATASHDGNWFDLNRRLDTSPLFCVEPVVLELAYNGSVVCVEDCTLQVPSQPW